MPALADSHAIQDLKPGDHACFVFESETEYRDVVAACIRQGLAKNEKIIFAGDSRRSLSVLNQLSQENLDIAARLDKGQVALLNATETYVRQGAFDPGRMMELWQVETQRALAEGYSALRAVGDADWAAGDCRGADRLIEYETSLGEFFPHNKCLALCLYDKKLFSPEILNEARHAHPIVLEPVRRPGTILVADDDTLIRSLISRTLFRQGHKALEAENGEEAFKKIREKSGGVDLLIADVAMPGMGGVELREKISKIYPDTKILFITAHPESLVDARGKALEDVHVLQKPFSLRALLAEIEKILRS